ncbi:insulin-like growth factor 2 mRNA-binding protein 1 [Striga asiatica]|uniref:Insulin-like growth factor 2 mRNA-binding protein 1 n=1 Tax=Striga asiatica TaxID=4170 RepID=A0A5A7R8K8_STRAF|nr:insulin-like growth factor 2 mRNA-binding protein 1 [Striga asiatica]
MNATSQSDSHVIENLIHSHSSFVLPARPASPTRASITVSSSAVSALLHPLQSPAPPSSQTHVANFSSLSRINPSNLSSSKSTLTVFLHTRVLGLISHTSHEKLLPSFFTTSVKFFPPDTKNSLSPQRPKGTGSLDSVITSVSASSVKIVDPPLHGTQCTKPSVVNGLLIDNRAFVSRERWSTSLHEVSDPTVNTTYS